MHKTHHKKYEIELKGCDDSTVFEMLLNESQYALVNELCTISEDKARYQCMPIMTVKEVKS